MSALSAAGLAALVTAPTFAIRRLALAFCELEVAAVRSLVDAP